ncbi:putative GTP-binding protein EngB, partial [Haemophilus influenzae]
KKI